MNIVYRLVNRSKSSGTRFYIGSKTECHIVSIDGVATMMQRNHKPYFGSSSNVEMVEDLKNGDVFEVEVLEEVTDKNKLLEREGWWIEHSDAVESADYYNLSYARVNGSKMDAPGNKFGELVKEIAKSRSSLSKRDKGAIKYGFANFGEMMFWVWEQIDSGRTFADCAKDFGTHRHRLSVFAKGFDKDKAREDVKRVDMIPQIRKMYGEGATLHYISKRLEIDLVAARVLLGDFNADGQRQFLAAKGLGLTKEELEVHITKMILDGAGFREVSKEVGLNLLTVKRYFLRCIRSRLKSSDL